MCRDYVSAAVVTRGLRHVRRKIHTRKYCAWGSALAVTATIGRWLCRHSQRNSERQRRQSRRRARRRQPRRHPERDRQNPQSAPRPVAIRTPPSGAAEIQAGPWRHLWGTSPAIRSTIVQTPASSPSRATAGSRAQRSSPARRRSRSRRYLRSAQGQARAGGRAR